METLNELPLWSRLLAVATGGAAGAVCRYLVSDWMARITHPSAFPAGTLTVNILGSFLIGLLMGWGDGQRWVSPLARALIGTGFLGALTTFSTFSYETLDAFRAGDSRIALLSIAANLAGALAGCWLGLEAGSRL